MLLDNHVVLISGVGPGLGRSLAIESAKAGAKVALLARRVEVLDAVGAEIAAIGGESLSVPTDITDEAACDAAVATVLDQWGQLDGVVNNAFQQPNFELLADQSLDTVRQSFEINVYAHLAVTKAALPALTASPNASVLMTLSSVLRKPRPMFGAYKMNKHALLGLARSLATELGPHGIRVNSIAPGYIYDDPVKFYFQMLADAQGRTAAEVEAEITAEHPLGKIPTPDDIAQTAVFFLSDLARAVTGQCLDVNGGEYMI